MSSLDVRSIDEQPLRLEPCPKIKQEFRFFFSELAFDRMVARGDGDSTREVGGVLVGELLRDDAGPYLRIDDTIDALHADEKGAELTFTHATWEHIHKEMDGTHPDKRLVGWYHTHPGFGIFLSDRDRFIHKSFFNLPFQIAFVYDPKTREHGVFGWHDDQVWRARRYAIGAREQIWDGPRTAGDDPRDLPVRKILAPVTIEHAHSAVRATHQRDDVTPFGSLWPLALCGFVLVIGLLAGRWLGNAQAEQRVQDAQRAAEQARSENDQLAADSRQNEMAGVLRDAFGDEALRKPIQNAIDELDRTIADLPTEVASDAGHAAGPGASSGAPGGAGSGALGDAGSGAPGGAGSGASPGGAGSGAPASAVGVDPRVPRLVAQLKASRERLFQLSQGHLTARATFTEIERVTRPHDELAALHHELRDQRSALGAAYAELATVADKLGDGERARRLRDTAGTLDPDNRARYTKQPEPHEAAKPPHNRGAAANRGATP